MTETDDGLRAADGRVPGRRGLRTRRLLLDCTAAALGGASYRDLKVVDIAREADTSPATFYQYFPDVEAAILALAEEMAEEGNRRLVEIVRTGSWKGRQGYATAAAIAESYIAFWDDNSALMRVIDLTSEEGDQRFRDIRVHLLNEFTVALAEVITSEIEAGRQPPEIEAMATAGVLVSMLAHVASHRYGFENYGISAESLREAMARIVFTSVTGQRTPRAK